MSDVGWAIATQLSTLRGEGEADSGTSWRSEGCNRTSRGAWFDFLIRAVPERMARRSNRATEEGRDGESGFRTADSVHAVAVAETDVLKGRMRRRSKCSQ